MILCLICQKLKASALPSPTCTTTRSRGFLGCKAIERISTWHKLLQETWMKHPFALKMTGTTKVLNWEPYQNFTNTVSSWSNAQKLLISSFPIWPPPVFDVASPVQDSRHSTGETCLKLWKFQVSSNFFAKQKAINASVLKVFPQPLSVTLPQHQLLHHAEPPWSVIHWDFSAEHGAVVPFKKIRGNFLAKSTSLHFPTFARALGRQKYLTASTKWVDFPSGRNSQQKLHVRVLAVRSADTVARSPSALTEFQQFQWFTGCLQVYRYIKIQHFSIRFLFRYLPKLTGASMANTPPDMSNSSNSMGTWSECPTHRLQLQNSKGKCFGSFMRCVQLNVTSIKMPPGNTWKNFPHGQYVEPRLDVACSATMLLEAGSPRRQL